MHRRCISIARTATGIEDAVYRSKLANVRTYQDIQLLIKTSHGWTPRTCWIAHCKELLGLPVKPAANRIGAIRTDPCPVAKQPAILSVLERSYPE